MPPGPTKLKGPLTLLLAAAWNWSDVPAGSAAFVHVSVLQVAVNPEAGLASFAAETKSPEGAKPVIMKVLKPRLLETPAGNPQVEPLLAEVALRPPE